MLCSNLVERLQNIVIVALVLVSYASNVLSRSNQIAKNAIESDKNQNSSTIMKKVPFVEYYIEHNISQGDAKRNFFNTGIKFVDDKPPRWCMECTDLIYGYCKDGRMLADHCCCDSRHGAEQIPWIPHSCYVGERCTPTTHSCINYTEIRQCCCDRILAKYWKEVFSSSMPTTTLNLFTQLACVLLLIISRSPQ